MQGGCGLSLNCDSSVKELQTLYFPVSPRRSDSFLNSFFLKSTTVTTEIEEEHLEQIVRFKDPKEFTARDADCPSQPPRWPTECQVLEEKIEHIDHVPAVPEPYYVPTGKEVQPKPVGEECGIVVYQYYPISAVNYSVERRWESLPFTDVSLSGRGLSPVRVPLRIRQSGQSDQDYCHVLRAVPQN
ncbi:Cytosolic carboxypeptidase N-terminal domain [Popillia japonica]|uniref:Cytosolic carboxypeptidase N-terminal domain n=1 Tax=Popillia japonica TaxID=7064 RepID=A0AAW1L550_POPJA